MATLLLAATPRHLGANINFRQFSFFVNSNLFCALTCKLSRRRTKVQIKNFWSVELRSCNIVVSSINLLAALTGNYVCGCFCVLVLVFLFVSSSFTQFAFSLSVGVTGF